MSEDHGSQEVAILALREELSRLRQDHNKLTRSLIQHLEWHQEQDKPKPARDREGEELIF